MAAGLRKARILLVLLTVFGFRTASGQIVFGLVFGPDARTTFEDLHQTFGGHFIDFNGLASGTRLDNEFLASDGVTFASNIGTTGLPLPNPHHMLVHVVGAPPNSALIGTIVGTPSSGSCCDDGRVGYEISFSTPQRWAGLLRIWNTSTITQFFDEMGELLVPQHFNTTGNEFVGYIAASDDPADWVSRIQIDGASISNSRQVGYSDDLYFGTAIPEPTTVTLFVLGAALALVAGRRRRT